MLYDFCLKEAMHFIQGNNRNQTYFATLEDQVASDDPVRLMDAFIGYHYKCQGLKSSGQP
jgi:hypothetical protein